jgi:hypothetical protein
VTYGAFIRTVELPSLREVQVSNRSTYCQQSEVDMRHNL